MGLGLRKVFGKDVIVNSVVVGGEGIKVAAAWRRRCQSESEVEGLDIRGTGLASDLSPRPV